MTDAFVFNCHYNGLSIIQELGRRGVRVYALDDVRSVGTFSRYARYVKCPNPLTHEQPFIELLLELGPRFAEKPVLFPTHDHWASAVSKHRERLSEFYRPCAAGWDCTRLLIEKSRFYAWAEQRGYPVPRTWAWDQAAQIPPEAFPLAVKPEYRRISGSDPAAGRRLRALDRLRLTRLDSPAELRAFANSQAALLPHMIVQEYVAGLSDSMYTVGVYASADHRVCGLFTGRKLRGFPPDVGDCTAGQAEALPAELVEMVRRLAEEIGLEGIAEFEFKRDARTGQFRLIEVNPRSWSWVGITPACGVSLPWLAYQDLRGEPVTDSESQAATGSVKWAKTLDDLLNCLYFNQRAGFPEWSLSLAEWRASLKAGRRVWAEFAADDPLPGLYALQAALRRVGRAALPGLNSQPERESQP